VEPFSWKTPESGLVRQPGPIWLQMVDGVFSGIIPLSITPPMFGEALHQ